MKPYQGQLVNLITSQKPMLQAHCHTLYALRLNQRQLCDLELLISGALSPLTGFMNQRNYQSVVENTQLCNGTIWPIPYYLDLNTEQAQNIKQGDSVALVDGEGFAIAKIIVESKWQADKKKEAENIYGSVNQAHPGVDYLMNRVGDVYIGGKVEAIQIPQHYDYECLRKTPQQLREYFKHNNFENVIAFHTSQAMHQVQVAVTKKLAKLYNAQLLIHPVIGHTKPGDLHYNARIACYQAVIKYYKKNSVSLALTPIGLRMAGPKEALMNAIIRQNYGCSHYIMGAEHAAPPNVRELSEKNQSTRFYATGESQNYVAQFKDKINIKIINAAELCYNKKTQRFVEKQKADKNCVSSYTHKKIIASLTKQQKIPNWVSYTEVISALEKAYPSPEKIGLTLFFTGLSGSGKSTLGKIIYAKLIEQGNRQASLLDGDELRQKLFSGLGFSKQDRIKNLRGIAYIATEITKNRGVAICTPIAPYQKIRQQIRAEIEQYGVFIEVYLSTSLKECEKRDRKGLYVKARKGEIANFTGISDCYEIPTKPEIIIDTENTKPNLAAQKIMHWLAEQGYITDSSSSFTS